VVYGKIHFEHIYFSDRKYEDKNYSIYSKEGRKKGIRVPHRCLDVKQFCVTTYTTSHFSKKKHPPNSCYTATAMDYTSSTQNMEAGGTVANCMVRVN